jgi:two-component system, NtrC family, sensor kinase
MPETDRTRKATGAWLRLRHGLGTKLIALLTVALIVIFVVLAWLTVRLHHRHLEMAALTSAERVSDVITRSTSYYMMRNDREGLYHTMATMANEPGMVKVRIFDRDGRITYSSSALETSRVVDKDAEACYACHAQSQPLTKLNRPDRFRVYRAGNGPRVLAIITPIENQPSCSTAECHAHPASQQILGVLDTHLSLARADAQVAEGTQLMLVYDAIAMLCIALLIGVFIHHFVGEPLKKLRRGTERLTSGDLGYQIQSPSNDELGDLAQSFNAMSLQLRSANEEIVAWAHTLEDRVAEKTEELRKTHDEVLHVETMASLGKLAAVVAHEINNPLAGILTYSKLLRKWVDRGETSGDKKQEALQCLDLVASESRRCGELCKNLLSFSRTAPMNVESTDINVVVERCLLLVRHNLDLAAIQLDRDLAMDLPRIQCDPTQIEQVLLALVMNAMDAMPHGGTLLLRTGFSENDGGVELQVRDDGAGIPAEILPTIFEPFVTTKDRTHGTGLGLAVSRSIIERHSGRISIQSEVGKGTTVIITLPVSAGTSLPAMAGPGAYTNTR